ncbi:XdhC family protein [Cocleimonas sp. KMM 6892]|uniref:XdhC family protein n=1 Tax=unclassified Cocleimonas TaxID=2639732 RepID=UPI002DB7DB62|nr:MULTISPECIES: XdhC family protein [unclassified Cocleimonas]MEB8432634.1 XdhC family protein [Cocleimonas sp. KMM 6892]MEC4715493.1 XdhC family protein [Cocleimonas sp. KMM 6895]MEC4744889.1 XdhC family protein [Cocleimonas sp. KMM 6896]
MIETDSILLKASELKIKRQPFALVTVVRCESPTSAKPGAKALVFESGEIQGWIGGGCAQPAVIATVKKSLKDGQGRLIRVSPDKGKLVDDGIINFGMNCLSGGTLDIFIDPVIPKPALLIIGAAPSAQALSILAHRTGFEVTAMFPGANKELYPDAIEVIDGLDASALKYSNPPFVVVATQGKGDEDGLKQALATNSEFIGFIASERKAKKVKVSLIESGNDKNKVDAIISPIGIEIGAITPEEIALSVVAELVKANRGLAASASSVEEVIAEEKATVEEKTAEEAPSCCGSMGKDTVS